MQTDGAATGVGRDSVRSYEGGETANADQASQNHQSQVPASASKQILFYLGIFIAFIAALGVIGLGFGMWKSSKDPTTNPSFDSGSASQLASPANSTDLATRYAQSVATFLPYPEFNTV
jgi:hypothetical protein